MNILEISVDNNIALRTWSIDNAQELFKLVSSNREYLGEWLPWISSAKTLEDTKKFIQSALNQYDNGLGLELGIWYGEKIIGAIGLHEVSKMHNKTSIGYWLSRDFQGKGIMNKSVIALINFCFEKLNINRVEIKVAVGNEKSKSIPEKLGFVKEGILREAELLDNKYVDWNFYAMLKKDWSFSSNT